MLYSRKIITGIKSFIVHLLQKLKNKGMLIKFAVKNFRGLPKE